MTPCLLYTRYTLGCVNLVDTVRSAAMLIGCLLEGVKSSQQEVSYVWSCVVIPPQVQLCLRPGGSFGLQPGGRSPDETDEPERRSAVPGDPGLHPAGQ